MEPEFGREICDGRFERTLGRAKLAIGVLASHVSLELFVNPL